MRARSRAGARRDRGGPLREEATVAGGVALARLARRAEKHGGALLLLGRAAQAGTFASATIELERGPSLWDGAAGRAGRLLRGVRAVGAVARHKRMPPSGPLPLHLPLEAP